jgi:hypothetical protein
VSPTYSANPSTSPGYSANLGTSPGYSVNPGTSPGYSANPGTSPDYSGLPVASPEYAGPSGSSPACRFTGEEEEEEPEEEEEERRRRRKYSREYQQYGESASPSNSGIGVFLLNTLRRVFCKDSLMRFYLEERGQRAFNFGFSQYGAFYIKKRQRGV